MSSTSSFQTCGRLSRASAARLLAACSSLALTTAAPSFALAQSAPSAPAPGNGADGSATASEVVVTGSRIVRRDFVSDTPIATVNQSFIKMSGAVTIDGALNELPQFAPSASSTSNNPSRSGQASVDLRGLGQQRTLVLIDGQRAQPSSPDGSVDLNTIPTAMIDSVEVITGGASAIYGSDAVSGVVNFKLKKNFQGLQLNVQDGVTQYGDGRTQDVSVLMGGNFANDKGNAIVSLDYSNREAVYTRDRSVFDVSNFSSNLPNGVLQVNGSNLPSKAAVNAVFAQYGIAPGTVSNSGTIGFNSNGTLFSASKPVVNFDGPTANIYNDGTTLHYLAGNFNYLQTPLQRYTLFAKSSYDISPSIKASGQLSFTHYSATEQIGSASNGGSGTTPVYIPVTNPFIPADLATLLASRPNPTAPFLIQQRMTEAGDRSETDTYNVFQVNVGLSGAIPINDWTWDTNGSYGRVDFDDRLSGYPSYTALSVLFNAPDGGASLCTGGYNPFGVQPVSTSCQNYLDRSVTNTTTLEQQVVEASLQGKVASLWAGDVRFAAGADYRRTSYDYRPDALVSQNDLVNGTPSQPSQGATQVEEVYAELLIPVLKDLPFVKAFNIDLADRYSSYNTIGGVNTYKADADWQLVNFFALRGGYSRAIRAPSAGELYAGETGGTTTFGAVGPAGSGDACDIGSYYRSTSNPNAANVRALCLAQGVPASIIDTYKNTETSVPYDTEGNSSVKQETADTYSIGGVVTSRASNPLISNMSVSIDYYNINIMNAIGFISSPIAMEKCFNADGSNPTYSSSNYYCSLISRQSGSGLVNIVLNPELNLGGYKSAGVDLNFDWKVGLGAVGLNDRFGFLRLNVLLTYLSSFEIQSLPNTPYQQYSGTIGNTQIDPYADAFPRWKSVTTLTYSNGPVDLTGAWRFIDAMSNAANVGTTGTSRGVDAISYFDLSANWRVTTKYQIQLGVVNLANLQPPHVGTTVGATDSTTYDQIGRRFYVNLTARF